MSCFSRETIMNYLIKAWALAMVGTICRPHSKSLLSTPLMSPKEGRVPIQIEISGGPYSVRA